MKMTPHHRKSLFVLAAFVCAAVIAAPAPLWAQVDYKPKIEGVKQKSLVKDLEANSYLFQFLKNKPLSKDGLERRAADDVLRLRDTMIGQGYYGADIQYKITGDAEPYTVILSVNEGPQFLIGRYDVAWQGKGGRAAKAPPEIDLDDLLKGIGGQPATPGAILDREQKIVDALKENGYPLPAVIERKVLVDHATQTADVTLVLRSGTSAHFGKTDVKGQSAVDEDFIRRRIGWQEGDTFNIEEVVGTRRDMLQTGLFSSVDVLLDAKDGRPVVPATIQVAERAPRTIGAGVAYSTSRSIEGKVFWEHRNLGGGGEKLRLEADAGIDQYGLGAIFTKPDLGGSIKRSMQITGGYRDEFLDSYDKTSYKTGVTFNNRFTKAVTGSIGGGLEFSQIKENDEPERDYWLLSLPVGLKYDTTNDTLDPVRGVRAASSVTPYLTINQSQETFTVTELSASHYLPVNDEKIVFANRVKLGAIFGQGTTAIPADKRFYSGGGGSVRGYGYQLISPLDDNDDPTGGRFQVEVGSEVRFRVSETIGIVPFVEGGRVTEDISWGGDERFLWAAGIGMRYYTAVGPLRADIAVPLNGRDKDDPFQVYFSLGQAF